MPTLNEILNSPIGKKALKIVYPTKKDMNLYRKLEEGSKPSKVILLVLICILIIALVCKFGVIDRLDKVNNLENEYNRNASQLTTINDELNKFSEVKEKYYRNTDNYLTEEEAVLVDRIEIIKMVSSSIKGFGTLEQISIVNNDATVVVRTDNLEKVSNILSNIRNDQNVTMATVKDAFKRVDNDDSSKSYVESTINIALEKKEAE